MIYKKLGDFISEIDIRNVEEKTDGILGVSVSKVFIPTIANTIGTDFSKYKVIKRNEFAYIPDTSRRGDKIGIALLNQQEEALVSQAYTVFKTSDDLLPEYLMLWFQRPEFDRYARYHSIGSAREVFSWDDMCNVELPIPSIEEQKEIVRKYKVITDRIKVLTDINQKLEETALALYKFWFVDFKPFGGAMPDDWEIATIEDVCKLCNSGGTPQTGVQEYWEKGDISWFSTKELKDGFISESEEKITQEGLNNSSAKLFPTNTILMAIYASPTVGRLGILTKSAAFNQAAVGLVLKDNVLSMEYMYLFLKTSRADLNTKASGSAQQNLNVGIIKHYPILRPSVNVHSEFYKKVHPIFEVMKLNSEELDYLMKLKDILLPKLMTGDIN